MLALGVLGIVALVFAAAVLMWEGATAPVGIRVYVHADKIALMFDDADMAREFVKLNRNQLIGDAG